MIAISSKFVNGVYNLTRLEARVFFTLASKLTEDALDSSTTVELSRRELIDRMGKSCNSKQLKEVAESLEKQSFEVTLDTPNQDGSLKDSLSLSKITYKRGRFVAEFAPELASHFVGLSSRFVKLSLDTLFEFTSFYSLRFYLLLSEYFKFGFRKFVYYDSVVEMFRLPESYKTFAIFKASILTPVLDEISTLTDIEVSDIDFSRRKYGRAMESFKVFVKSSAASLKGFIELVRELYTGIDLFKTDRGIVYCSSSDGRLRYSDTYDELPANLALSIWKRMHRAIRLKTGEFLPFEYEHTSPSYSV